MRVFFIIFSIVISASSQAFDFGVVLETPDNHSYFQDISLFNRETGVSTAVNTCSPERKKCRVDLADNEVALITLGVEEKSDSSDERYIFRQSFLDGVIDQNVVDGLIQSTSAVDEMIAMARILKNIDKNYIVKTYDAKVRMNINSPRNRLLHDLSQNIDITYIVVFPSGSFYVFNVGKNLISTYTNGTEIGAHKQFMYRYNNVFIEQNSKSGEKGGKKDRSSQVATAAETEADSVKRYFVPRMNLFTVMNGMKRFRETNLMNADSVRNLIQISSLYLDEIVKYQKVYSGYPFLDLEEWTKKTGDFCNLTTSKELKHSHVSKMYKIPEGEVLSCLKISNLGDQVIAEGNLPVSDHNAKNCVVKDLS